MAEQTGTYGRKKKGCRKRLIIANKELLYQNSEKKRAAQTCWQQIKNYSIKIK
jgi:hypothetical protein